MREACACDGCLAHAWLLGRVAGHLECVRDRIEPLMALGDEELIEAVGGAHRPVLSRELEAFDPADARQRAAAVGVEVICRCHPRYPPRLLALSSPPAALHVAGGMRRFLELADRDPVALVGARKASDYGLEVARSLGRGLGAAGVCVVSGMAFGVDSAAHAGALAAGAATVAVLPGPADRPYPAAKRSLYREILEAGVAVSELPPGSTLWRWMFPARNRIIAALAALTVVVEGSERSGSLLTAAVARGLGRSVGAVPGRVSSPLAAGPNQLLASGARLVRGPQDVLDHLFGAGSRVADGLDERPLLEPRLRPLLDAIATGADTPLALRRAGLSAGDGLAALAALEIAGYVQRGAGGRFVAVP